MNRNRATTQSREAKATSVAGILLVAAIIAIVVIGGMAVHDFVQTLTGLLDAPHKSH